MRKITAHILKTFVLPTMVFVASGAYATSFPDSLLFKEFADQYKYKIQIHEELHKLTNAEAIARCEELENWAKDKGDERLSDFFHLLKYTHTDERTNGLNPFIEEGMSTLLKKIDSKNDHLRAYIRNQLANYYWTNEKYALSFEQDLTAYKIITRLTTEEWPCKFEFLHNLGGHYYHFRDYSTSKRYFLELCRESKSVSSLNTLALCYSNLSNHDSALFYFNKAYENTDSAPNNVWKGILNGNIGHIYFLRKDYNKAIELFVKCVAICKKNRVSANAAHALAELSNIYLAAGEKEKAYRIAKEAYDSINNGRIDNYFDLIKNAYPRIAKVLAAYGDYEMAWELMDSGMMAKDTMNRRSNALLFAGVQHKLDVEEHLQDQVKYEREERFQTLVRNGLIGGVLLIGVIAALLINRQRLKYKHEQEQLQIEKLQTKAELLSATAQLEDFTKSITEKNELIEKFAAEMNRMNEASGTVANTSLEELQRATILSDGEWTRFQAAFDKVHNGFLSRLQKKVQGLSPVETRFMLLSRLRLSNKEMAGALGISTDAARLNRERLRNKLSLPDKEHSLEDFAASI